MIQFPDDDDFSAGPPADDLIVTEDTVYPPIPSDAAKVVAEDAPSEEPIAYVFPSRTKGERPHVVIVMDLVPVQVACTCPAMRSLEQRPAGCWAMQKVREMLGVNLLTG